MSYREKLSVVRRHGVALLLAWVAALACSQSAQAGTVPGGFQETAAFTGLSNPTAITFAPDGRVFVGEKSGLIKLYDGLGDTTPTTFADLRTETYNFWDRGLLGMTIDPQFPARPYIYALYTLNAEPGGAIPRWVASGGDPTSDPCPSPPGPTGDGCVATGRLARLTVSGNTMSAKTNLITDWCQQYPSHSVGDIAFGADGALYVSGGDGASFNFVDYGQDGNPVNPCGDPPAGIGGAMTAPTAEGGALRSQDSRTTSDPTSLDGAILRVDPDTGAGLPGNPFAGSPDANQRRIAAIGSRNPFRITIRPGTDEVWSGDVGWNEWEEITRIADPSDATADNLGWPCYEGAPRQGGYDGANLNLCESLYGQGAGAVLAPYHAYRHSSKVVSGETCPTGSSSISGLRFYQSGPFPDSYDGALFFSDYSRDCIWAMLPGGNGLPDPSTIQTFDAGASNPVDVEINQGELFYANLDGGTIQRVFHPVANQPPTAVAAANPDNGAAPLNVQLDASGSSDPDDAFATLGFAWDADNDGQFDDGNQVTLNRTYAAGTHVARVRVTDPDGASNIDSVSIQSDNTPPIAQIGAPTAGGTTWAVDDVVGFSGSATDAQQTLPASAFDWEIVIDHCPSNCHQHVAEQISDVTGGSFSAPDHEYPSTLTLRLTVTDQGGLSDSESVTISPRTVNLTLDSLPGGLQLGLNAATATAPFTRTVIDGSQNTVIAPTPQSLGGQSHAFGSWSDAGAATHNITADQDMTLVATYSDVTPPAPPQITATVPAGPANDNDPEVRGTVGAGAPTQVELYRNATCSGAPAASGTVATFTGAGITVNVGSDATTALSARASDQAGNDSGCSNTINYTEDSTGPAAPAITDTDPDSPANDNNPEVKGSVGAGAPTQVELYRNATCSGAPAASGTVATFTGAGITVNVGSDATTALSARASDQAGNDSGCSNTINYTEDSTGPAAPAITDTDPDSPANDNNPEVKGSVGAGAPTQVELYRNATCSGASAATGTVAAFTGAGITVNVGSDATTELSARASDQAGNESVCSNTIDYVEDSTEPATPAIADTDPDSPANDNDPEVKGSAAADTTVRLYRSGDCSGAPAAEGPAAEFSGSGLTASVPDDATTAFTAIALDGANASDCSAPFAYREDSTGPETAITGGPPAKVKVLPRRAKVRGTSGGKLTVNFSASEPVSGFQCRLDDREYVACNSPLLLTGLKRGAHLLLVRAVDAVGNVDATPASHQFRAVKRTRSRRNTGA